MTQIFRCDNTIQNCWKCDHFRRDSASPGDPNVGSCTAKPPQAQGAVSENDVQDDVNPHISLPNVTYCGDFKPWTGEPRAILPVVE
jgi:hypothetical protein